MYVNMVFQAVFIGYSVGTAPVIGYHYGAENHSELKGLLKNSTVIVAIFAGIMFIAAEILAVIVTLLFLIGKRKRYNY